MMMYSDIRMNAASHERPLLSGFRAPPFTIPPSVTFRRDPAENGESKFSYLRRQQLWLRHVDRADSPGFRPWFQATRHALQPRDRRGVAATSMVAKTTAKSVSGESTG